MTVRIWKIYPSKLAGEIPFPHALLDLDHASEMIPGGAYTSFRTYELRGVVQLDDHFARLEDTAALAGYQVSLDRNTIRQALRDILGMFPGEESRFRITVDLENEIGSVYVCRERLIPPSPDAYQHGVKALTVSLKRKNPKAKLTKFIEVASKIRKRLPKEINEAIMIDENNDILEGLSSNFFAVLNNELWTAGDRVLAGTTRNMVLKLAADAGIPIKMECIKAGDINLVSECFITSVSRGVLPVVQIDDHMIGKGSPGSITRLLIEKFSQLVKENVTII